MYTCRHQLGKGRFRKGLYYYIQKNDVMLNLVLIYAIKREMPVLGKLIQSSILDLIIVTYFFNILVGIGYFVGAALSGVLSKANETLKPEGTGREPLVCTYHTK